MANAQKSGTTTSRASSSVVSGDQSIPTTHHTPGPWRIDDENDGELWVRNSEHPVCMVTASGHVTDRDRGDARLIAAAPEILMALEMAIPALQWCEQQWADSPQKGDGVNVLQFARAAVALATGA